MFDKLYPPIPDFTRMSRGAQAHLSNERWAQYVVQEYDYHKAIARRTKTEDWLIAGLTLLVIVLVLVAL